MTMNPADKTLDPKNPRCDHCGGEIFWGFPHPDDPCFHCDKPVRKRKEQA